MKIEIKKIDIVDSLKYNTTIVIEMLHINDLWKIDVPNIIENNELIYNLSNADDFVNKYTEILSDVFKLYNYKNAWKRVKKRFVCSPSTPINKDVILPSTIEISDDFAKYGIKRKMWEGDLYCYRGFGTVINGELISSAVENSHFLDEKSTEIAVKTDVNHRQKGYAASNVVALCDCLLKNGISNIYYECDLNNIASFSTAKKANLEYIGEVFYLGFKN